MIVALDHDTLQDPPRTTPQKPLRATTRQDARTGALVDSPYTAKNIDGAITHLEFAVAADGNIAVFGRRYWLDRVERVASTPKIMPAQARRLQSLLDQLKGAGVPGTP